MTREADLQPRMLRTVKNHLPVQKQQRKRLLMTFSSKCWGCSLLWLSAILCPRVFLCTGGFNGVHYIYLQFTYL